MTTTHRARGVHRDRKGARDMNGPRRCARCTVIKLISDFRRDSRGLLAELVQSLSGRGQSGMEATQPGRLSGRQATLSGIPLSLPPNVWKRRRNPIGQTPESLRSPSGGGASLGLGSESD
jgi:hypothetical protein